jgi:hypothetical protein
MLATLEKLQIYLETHCVESEKPETSDYTTSKVDQIVLMFGNVRYLVSCLGGALFNRMYASNEKIWEYCARNTRYKLHGLLHKAHWIKLPYRSCFSQIKIRARALTAHQHGLSRFGGVSSWWNTPYYNFQSWIVIARFRAILCYMMLRQEYPFSMAGITHKFIFPY